MALFTILFTTRTATQDISKAPLSQQFTVCNSPAFDALELVVLAPLCWLAPVRARWVKVLGNLTGR